MKHILERMKHILEHPEHMMERMSNQVLLKHEQKLTDGTLPPWATCRWFHPRCWGRRRTAQGSGPAPYCETRSGTALPQWRRPGTHWGEHWRHGGKGMGDMYRPT